MKDQYFGDVNDFQKYALLRRIARPASLKLGVCWMLTESDGRSDGRHLDYLNHPARFRAHDPELFDWLRVAICHDHDRRTARIELSPLLGNAVFQSRLLKDSRAERDAYFAECRDLFGDRDLVFFDPDNGIERSVPAGRRGSSKYVYWNEIVATFESGASILFYQHFPREKRESFTTKLLDELRCRTESVHVCAWPTSHVVFLAAFHGAFSLPERLMKPE